MTAPSHQTIDHLAGVPSRSFQMPREALLAQDIRGVVFECPCGQTHVWSIVDGRLVVDGEDVTDAL